MRNSYLSGNPILRNPPAAAGPTILFNQVIVDPPPTFTCAIAARASVAAAAGAVRNVHALTIAAHATAATASAAMGSTHHAAIAATATAATLAALLDNKDRAVIAGVAAPATAAAVVTSTHRLAAAATATAATGAAAITNRHVFAAAGTATAAMAAAAIARTDHAAIGATAAAATAAATVTRTNHAAIAGNAAAATAAASVQAFDISSLQSQMVAWYRSDLLTQASGTVSSMTDKSPSGVNATQTTGTTHQPNYSSGDAAFNSKPSVANTATRWLETASSLTWGPFTIFMVALSSSSASYLYVHGSDTGASAEYLYTGTGQSTKVSRASVITSWNIATAWGNNAAARTIVESFDGTHAGHKVRINGTNQTMTNTSGNDPGTATVSGILGIMCKPGGSSIAVGKFAEFIVFNSALSVADIQNVESYLRTRYAHY